MALKLKHIRFVTALLCCFLLFSCAGGGDPVQTVETSAPPQASNGPLTLVSGDATDYAIVYAAAGDAWERGFATRLQNSLLAVTGVKIPVVKDTDRAADANAKEIILATPANNRASTYTAKGGVGYGYNLFVDGSRLIMEIYSPTGAFFALSALCKAHFNIDLELGETLKRNDTFTSLEIAPDLSLCRTLASSEMPYLGAPLSEFVIACDELNYLHHSIALEMARSLTAATGADQEILLYDIYFGLEEDGAYITLEEDAEMKAGDWRYTVESDKLIRVYANGYYGMLAAIEALTARVTFNDYFDLRVGDSDAGDYLQFLSRSAPQDQTHRYAYDRQGDHRVMFYNALWGDNYYNQFEYIAYYRDPFEVALIEAYAPDVLGLQEISNNRRGVGNQSDLIGKLEDLGYREAIDPLVENMRPLEEGGYGTGGGGIFTREDGSTYYSYKNCSPLLYNTATTVCVEAGFHWYTQQQNEGAEPIGAGDAASKCLTWGVFRSIETDEIYAVISTHMRRGTVELSQAQEAIAVIEEIEANYHCPVFFGGDMNSSEGNTCYDHFTVEKEFISLQQHKVAKVYTSPINSTHGYPVYKNGEMTVGNGRVWALGSKHESIDNIIVPSIEQLEINLFGVVADFCALRGSDHLPVFVDFNIKD